MAIVGNMLSKYSAEAEDAIAEYFVKNGINSLVEEAMFYASNGGKHFRTVLIFSIMDSLGHKPNKNLAIATEFAHASSLMLDDCPFMDDAQYRRGKLACHIKYGKDVTVLASCKLLAKSYEALVHGNLPPAVLPPILESFSEAIAKTAEGQYLDLHNRTYDEKSLMQIAQLKTAEVFKSACVIGWLAGGGSFAKLEDVKRMGSSLGVAFQILDDLKDRGEAKNNLVDFWGLEEAVKQFDKKIEGFLKMAKKLSLDSGGIKQIAYVLKEKITAKFS